MIRGLYPIYKFTYLIFTRNLNSCMQSPVAAVATQKKSVLIQTQHNFMRCQMFIYKRTIA